MNEALSIAVVGMSGRFPGASNLQRFWDNLIAGRECITTISAERLSAQGIDPALLKDRNFVPAKGVLAGADSFDASFFGFSPLEAQCLDPQHRVFLEECWSALENAGYGPGTFSGAIGLYAGSTLSRYLPLVLENEELVAAVGTFQILLDNDKDHLPTRVAFKLGLRGPCVNVQSACSTSLLAVHLAAQSLLAHECDIALAGGAAVSVPLESGYFVQAGGILSPDGHCRPFDALAQGTVAGNGAGAVVLRRLTDAVKSGDTIHAIILGSAVNNDGERRVGYTAPGVDGQVEVITSALTAADVDPTTIGYVEAHGSGTPLGDRIELVALKRAYGAEKIPRSCAVGSVKANIGHLDAAAGIAGFIKAVQVVKHGVIPPAINYQSPNEEIDPAMGQFFINTTIESWPIAEQPRRAAVSSFEIGGTNVHVILEQPPFPRLGPSSRRWQSVVLSARSQSELVVAAERLANHLQLHPECDLSDVAYTLQVGRKAFGHRLSFPCSSVAEAIEQLKSVSSRAKSSSLPPPVSPSIGFLLPGLGDHYRGMGSKLYANEPEFRRGVDECANILREYNGYDLRSWLCSEVMQSDDELNSVDMRLMLNRGSSETPEAASIAHPAIFAVEYALARMWMRWGVRPEALLGYSLGEIVAASLSGVLRLRDALRFVSARAALIDAGEPGLMLAVSLGADELSELPERVSIAGYLTDDTTVIAGPVHAIEAAEARFAESEIVTSRLRTRRAYHTTALRRVAEKILPLLDSFQMRPPAIPWVSNVTGEWIEPSEAVSPQYWVRHLCSAVQFEQAVRSVFTRCNVLLVTGPGSSLGSMAKRVASKAQSPVHVFSSMRSSYDRTPDDRELAAAVGHLWRAGVDIDWQAYWEKEQRRRVELPPYAFERKRHWVSAQSQRPQTWVTGRLQDAETEDPSRWFYVPRWRQEPLLLSNDTEMHVDEPWLVFTSCSAACMRVEKVMSGQRNVIRILPGPAFERAADGGFVMDPQRPEQYDWLLRELAASTSIPRTVVHLWGLEPRASFDDNCERTYLSAIRLAQALDRRFHVEQMEIVFVIEPSRPVHLGEPCVPEKAALTAAATVIAQEYPHLRCRIIEVSEPDPLALMREFKQADGPIIRALRGEARFIPGYDPVQLQSNTAPQQLRKGGHYVLLGGTGLIGKTIAEYLARSCAAKLTLVARGPADVGFIASLEALGSRVLSLAADMSVAGQLPAVLRTAREMFGEFHGVFHAAGVVGEAAHRLISEVDERAMSDQFTAKVRGLHYLEDALREFSCEFCLVISSLAPMLGGIGLCDYAAINAYSDAFVDSRAVRGDGVRWMSVNWEGWLEQDRARTNWMVTPEQAKDSLHRLFGHSRLTRVVIARGSWELRLRDTLGRSRASRGRIVKSNAVVRPMNPIERSIASIWREVLGIEDVGVDESFFDLGGDSLLATRVAARLRNRFQMQLSLRALLEARTIADLAEVIVEQMTIAVGARATNELARTVQEKGS